MSFTLETFDFEHGITVRVESDDYPLNPRKEHDQLGTMVCAHRHYDLGDRRVNGYVESWHSIADDLGIGTECAECRGNGTVKVEGGVETCSHCDGEGEVSMSDLQSAIEKVAVVLPLYLYDHSGITMRCSPFSCPWDSGQVGVIYMALSKGESELTHEKGNEKSLRDAIVSCLEAEVEEYDQYLTGDVWGYVVENADGEHLDSCWGYFGSDYAKQEAREIGLYWQGRESARIAKEIEDAAKEDAERLYWAERDVITA